MSKVKKRIIWLVIIVVAITAGYYFLSPKAPATVYTTVVSQKGDLKQTVSETGTIKTVNQTDLSFKVSGRVIKLLADVGDIIKTSQLLAMLDTGTLIAQLRQAQYEVEVQQETLSNMKDNRKTYEKDQRDAQRARVKAAEEAVSQVNAQIRDTRMYSPIDGIILKRNVDPYETTVANSPTPVFTVGNPDDMEIVVNVPESDIAKIKIGQNAEVTFDALTQEDVYPAAIVEIDPASTVIQDVVYYGIKLRLADADVRLKPGMTVNVDIHTAEVNNVLIIPLRAVKTEAEKKYVEILVDAEKGLTERRDVVTGLEGDEGMVEIKSGLDEGEKVVTFAKAQ